MTSAEATEAGGTRIVRGRLDTTDFEAVSGTGSWAQKVILVTLIIFGLGVIGTGVGWWVIKNEVGIAAGITIAGVVLLLAGTRRENWQGRTWLRIGANATGVVLMRNDKTSELLFIPWRYIADVRVGRTTFETRFIDVLVDAPTDSAEAEVLSAGEVIEPRRDEKGRTVFSADAGMEKRRETVQRLYEWQRQAVREGNAGEELAGVSG